MAAFTSCKMCEIEQQCSFGFTMDLFKELSSWDSLEKMIAICHDKDIKENGDQVEKHCHYYLKFNGVVPVDAIINKVNKIAGKEVIKNQHICKIGERSNKTERSKWADAVAYAIHAKNPEKHQYDKSDVLATYDFMEDVEKATSMIKDDKLRYYVKLIDQNTLTRYNYMEFMKIDEYTAYYHKLDKAFKFHDDILKNKFKKEPQPLDVIYICGPSGIGKSTLAKMICKTKSLDFAVSSSQNDTLQDYLGEPALILDELRPSNFRFSDLLKILDHNTRSSADSRYYNKFLFCNLIIITSILDLDDFYKEIQSKSDEPVKQLHRRCNIYIKMDKNLIRVYQYDKVKNNYENIAQYKNNVLDQYKIEELSFDDKEKTKLLFNDILGSDPSGSPAIPHDFMFVPDDIEIPFDNDNEFLTANFDRIAKSGLYVYHCLCNKCGHKFTLYLNYEHERKTAFCGKCNKEIKIKYKDLV